MEEFRLLFDKKIAILERNNQWKTAADIVLHQWEANPDDLNCLLCAGTQLWYTLLVMDYIRNDPSPPTAVEFISDIQLQKDLMNVTRYGFKCFLNNPIFNAYYGYMISLMPYFFLDYNGDYLGWQEKGYKMIRHSYDLESQNPFTKAMYYGLEDSEKNTPFFEACREIWSTITPEQWGDSEVQQYFFRILHGNSFGRTGDGLREPF